MTQMTTVGQLIEDIFRQSADKALRRESEEGISSGLSAVDELCGRLHPGTLLLFAGSRRQLKSTLAMQIAASAARDGHPVLWCSENFSARQLARRLLAVEAGIPLSAIVSGMFADAHWPLLTRATGRLVDEIPVFFLTRSGVYSESERIMSVLRESGIRLLVLDPVSVDERGAVTLETAKRFAEECGIPVIGIVDLPGKQSGKPPGCHELGPLEKVVEEEAEGLCFVHRFLSNEVPGEEPVILTSGRRSREILFAHDRHRFFEAVR